MYITVAPLEQIHVILKPSKSIGYTGLQSCRKHSWYSGKHSYHTDTKVPCHATHVNFVLNEIEAVGYFLKNECVFRKLLLSLFLVSTAVGNIIQGMQVIYALFKLCPVV